MLKRQIQNRSQFMFIKKLFIMVSNFFFLKELLSIVDWL